MAGLLAEAQKNKSAILSLVVIVIIVLAAIFVPMFWRFSYDQQNLEFANIPPQLQLYDLGEENYVYLTNDFKSIDTDSAGNLIAPSKMVKDDKTNRMYIYEINDKPLVVDYGVYFKAKSEFIQQEAANAATGLIPVADVEYLANYLRIIRPKAAPLPLKKQSEFWIKNRALCCDLWR